MLSNKGLGIYDITNIRVTTISFVESCLNCYILDMGMGYVVTV